MTTILKSIMKACDRLGIAPSRFGRLAMGDPRLVGDLVRGRKLRPETEVQLRRFIATMRAGRTAEPTRLPRVNAVCSASRQRGTLPTEAAHRAMMRHGSAMLLAAINREARS